MLKVDTGILTEIIKWDEQQENWLFPTRYFYLPWLRDPRSQTIWFMAKEVIMLKRHNYRHYLIAVHPANSCLKMQKVQLSDACHKSVVSCSHSSPKEMYAVTSSWIQGFMTPGRISINTNSKFHPAALQMFCLFVCLFVKRWETAKQKLDIRQPVYEHNELDICI